MNTNIVPADVSPKHKQEFIKNYQAISHNTGRLFLFSCDQKIEHLHDDFSPDEDEISDESINPEHLFKIASQGRIGAMATQLELIARYAKQYPSVNYIAKLNSKTNLVPTEQQDPHSAPLWNVHDVIRIKKESNLSICGIGITIYIGSEFEDTMLSFAADMIVDAHKHGLVAIVWMYPRGKAVKDESDAHLIAGVAGAANALGADFVKIKAPAATQEKSSAQLLEQVVAAAGNTKVICSGGRKVSPTQFIERLYEQLHSGHVAGTATGRNIFQHNLPRAIAMTQAISTLVYDNGQVKDALEFIKE